jgi:hypothetical protein
MDNTIIAAIIGAVAVIAAAIIGVIGAKKRKKRPLKAKDYFEAGLLVGKLQQFYAIGINRNGVDSLKKDIAKALARIGIKNGLKTISLDDPENAPNLGEEINIELKKNCTKQESSFFLLGTDVICLQTHLLIITVDNSSEKSNITNEQITQTMSVLKDLVQVVRFNLAVIGALQSFEGDLINKLESGLSNAQTLRLSSEKLYEELEMFKIRLEAWIEQTLPRVP